jgi:hypothetical protein
MNQKIKNNRVFKVRSRVKKKTHSQTEQKRQIILSYFPEGYSFPLDHLFKVCPFTMDQLVDGGRVTEIQYFRHILTVYLYMNDFNTVELEELVKRDHATILNSIARFLEALNGFDSDLLGLINKIKSQEISADRYDLDINERQIDGVLQMERRFMEKYAKFV